MQKLQPKLKNTPKDTSLVLCSVNSSLNKDQSLSVKNVKLSCNNHEENLSQHTGRSLKPLVYVVSKQGNPLMPCKPAKTSESKENVRERSSTCNKEKPVYNTT